ncbi:TetR family transcriptional regulator [Gordonia amarae]|uniref:TetR family transcriptional regulator n=2 Tax=Gordonia amarae TaxID=36821 RepID=A0A857KPC1_9ACTN|nr:TetR/AcrR family transcriptional regulator [Gordonia amarae]MCS3880677.1 TetR/AcrR family transcriptional regulator [Gordonia amarae]QHN18974.1 TetR family transcriptional regulator [Gordonia amarae]QHN23449.1 TetR family transcriptional regulator [Gordonia amarae]QHN32349.1 TetR family transcriptional regulator [Gordonia amarae]QHN41097.1 TetR family transcriptional regulator [Gordonia amarae]
MSIADAAAQDPGQDAPSGSRRIGVAGGSRAERTREAILDAARQLFYERGYAGVAVNAITEACGISRAGFYTYFKDKREIFDILSERAYRDLREVLARWSELPTDCSADDIRGFVRDYFAYMDRHGAFAMAGAHSGPDDDEFREGYRRMQTRVSWILGQGLTGAGSHSPEVVGSAVFGLLDRSWHTVRAQSVTVTEGEMVDLLTDMIVGMRR